MKKWIKVDGMLILDGTLMKIIYRPAIGGSYHLYQGDLYLWPYMKLAAAKLDAESIYAELVEIGAC